MQHGTPEDELSYSDLLTAYANVQGELAAERAKAKEVIRQLQLEVESLLEGAHRTFL